MTRYAKDRPESEGSRGMWRNWYLTVLILHVIVILLMYLFTLQFHP